MKIRDGGDSISAETYRTLREHILSGRIAPGTKVTTPDLCKTFGTSPGAVREALSRLHAEGLISAEAHRSRRVTAISIEDLRDLTQARVEIECICLTHSMEHGGIEWEANLVASAHRLARSYEDARPGIPPSPAHEDVHGLFHQALVNACNSSRLLRVREQLFDESERYRRFDARVAPNRNAAEEHRLIAEATVARNVKRARTLLAEHIERTTEAIIAAMTKQSTTLPEPSSQLRKVG